MAAPPTLVKISQLAHKSGVPTATIKHYVRQGLLPSPSRRAGSNVAYYDAALADRIKAIKELQRRHALSLTTIKRMLDDGAPDPVDAAAATIRKILSRERRRGDVRTRAQLLTAGMPPEVLEKVKERIPLGRLGRPEEIAEAVLFLVRSEYVTGHHLDVNGGLYM